MSSSCKYLILLGDGMADRPLSDLSGRTPLEAAKTPNMDTISSGGVLGLAQTIPDGMVKGSDIANLSVLGYDPAAIYTGRSPLEAAGMGVSMAADDVAFRCNLVTLGVRNGSSIITEIPADELKQDLVMVDFAAGHPSDEEARSIVDTLADGLASEGVELHTGVSYRHLLVWRGGNENLTVEAPHDLTDRAIGEGWPMGPASGKVIGLMERAVSLLADHPVNRVRKKNGRPPVNCIWLWGQGKRPRLPSFAESYGKTGAIITAVDLLKGIGVSLGLDVIDVPGATGYLDTDYEGKADAALKALEKVDLVYVHVEAPDEASHGGSLRDKIQAIEDFDSMVVGRVLKGLPRAGRCRLMVLPDHATPLEIKTHSDEPVPFAALDTSSKAAGSGLAYSESNAALTGIKYPKGHELMGSLINWNFNF